MQKKSFCCFVAVTCLLVSFAVCTIGAEDLQLLLPPDIYAVAGKSQAIYFRNAALCEHLDRYVFNVTCGIGKQETGRWVVTPQEKDEGDHPLRLSVRDVDGKILAETNSVLHVAPADAGAGEKKRILIIGDSLTGGYTAALAKMLREPGNPEWTMLGSNRVGNDGRHQGWGGKTWAWFGSNFNGKPRYTKTGNSPFVFADREGIPEIDIERYFDEQCDGKPPDLVLFMLGINDCMFLDPDNPRMLDVRIEQVMRNAYYLLRAFREAAPGAAIAVCATTPPNARESAFKANYGDRITRWNWKRVQHRLVQEYMRRYGGRAKEGFFFVPAELNLDVVGGYPENNAVHPNRTGYEQIATSMYAWIKCWLIGHAAGPYAGVAPTVKDASFVPAGETVKAGVFVHPLYTNGGPDTPAAGQTGVLDALLKCGARLDVRAINTLEPSILDGLNVVVVPNIYMGLPPEGWEDCLRNFVTEGGGVLLVHHSVGFRLSSDPLFPEICEGGQYVKGTEFVVVSDHPVVTGKGLEGGMTGLSRGDRIEIPFPDYIALRTGKAGSVLVEGPGQAGDSMDALAVGSVGKGRVVVCGMSLGCGYNQDARRKFTSGVADGGEREILLNSVLWLAGESAR